MDRRVALVALWAAFALASVGVGFGAAGLVGDPFADGVADAAPAAGAEQQPSPGSAVASGEASSSPTSTSNPRSPSAETSSAPATTTPGATASPPGSPPADRPVTRSLATRGGSVFATCRSGLVEVTASPAVGWSIEDIDRGRQDDADVRFESSDGDRRVEVEATCASGSPRFSVENDD